MAGPVIEKLDELNVKLLLGGAVAPETLRALAAIAQAAREAGRPLAADAATELGGRAAAAAPEEFEGVVSGGLEALRRALEGSAPVAGIADDPELIGDFVNEAGEHLGVVEAQVLLLERDPSSADPLHAAFRSFHTIKGLAGFLELRDIHEVSHEVETMLDRARNGDLAVTPGLIDVMLDSTDYLQRAIAWVGARLHGQAGAPPDPALLLAQLRGANGKTIGRSQEAPSATRSPVTPDSKPDKTEAGFTLRVDATKLDYMMDMVGELVIAQSLVAHHPALKAADNGPLQRNLTQLGRITGEVQRVAMSLRMTPVAQLFSRMTRLVRDVTRKSGKKVRLELSGEETELDKTIIEHLADPLMHMVRNSLDHGLETPAEREAKGKPPEGRLALAASHQAGHIVIQISDDGRGLNTEKILSKAREKGLVPEGQTPSEIEIFHLIFEPGFSTADRVTDQSGRGVGMDVVRRQIQALRGRVEIQSAPNVGATFFLRLPLTLAIIDGLIVGVGAERYIVPISSVHEILKPTSDMLFTIEGRSEMAMVRGSLLPVVRLGRRFGIATSDDSEGGNSPNGLFVVAECGGRRFCLLVEQMLGKQEVVIKSLGDIFRDVAGISGGAILGDGRVGLILDMNGVFRNAARA
jgi:two-component system chemotaxis sensor kinase CheA